MILDKTKLKTTVNDLLEYSELALLNETDLKTLSEQKDSFQFITDFLKGAGLWDLFSIFRAYMNKVEKTGNDVDNTIMENNPMMQEYVSALKRYV